LLEAMSDPGQFKDRDVTARAFAALYRTQHAEFPPECRDADYETRLKTAFPIHPEIFDRLYTDWSTLLKFQRTRGVLRLMAAVIHSLWGKRRPQSAHSPCMIPIDDSRVQFELTQRTLSSTHKQFGQHEHATSLRMADTMALVVTRRRIQVGRTIFLQWRVLSNLLRHIGASHSSKVFPI